MELEHKTVIEIVPTVPFHFDSTFYKPGHFPSGDTRWESGKRWQTMLWEGAKYGLIFINKSIDEIPKVEVQVFSATKPTIQQITSLKGEIIWRYNLNLDLSDFYNDLGDDALLAPIIRKFRGLRPMHYGSLYEYLLIAIVLQNATVRRSVYMMQTLFENYGTLLEFAGEKLWCFWKPEVLANASEQKLRELKMGYRAKSLIRVSEPFARGEINELELRNRKAEEQEKTLIALYGIGPASVGYIMFDVFHRWDHLKHISPWEQKIYNMIFFNKDWEKHPVSVKKMLKFFEKWKKWKSLAVHYVWEDIWWKRQNENIVWLEKLVRL